MLAAASGIVPPEAFIFLDPQGYIQDVNKVPTIYHIKRGYNQKAFPYQKNTVCNVDNHEIMFDTILPNKDRKDNHIKNIKKYWWKEDFDM